MTLSSELSDSGLRSGAVPWASPRKGSGKTHPLSGELGKQRAGRGRTKLKQFLLASLGFLPKCCQQCQLENILFPPFVFFLIQKKKIINKAIWCQIHSWHIIKGSTKNVPEKLKAKPQPYNMNLIAVSHNFRVDRSPEIKPFPYTGRN